MTTHRIHILHRRRPDWHTVKQHLSRLARDPRFWAAVILGTLVLVMLIVSFVVSHTSPAGPLPYGYPIYPYFP